MMYAQYCRLESRAGGCLSSDRAFIRACRAVLNRKGRSRVARRGRHMWIREGLKLKSNAINEYLAIVSGRVNRLSR